MIVGIGGASRSGKSELAGKLKSRNKELSIAIISQDDYVKPEHLIPRIKTEIDWECPESIDYEKFISAIKVSNQIYDVTIAEGLLIYNHKELASLFDKKIFIKIDKHTFYKRKSKDLRWGEIEDWYKEHIWLSYLKYSKLNSLGTEFILLNGSSNIDYRKIEHSLGLVDIITN